MSSNDEKPASSDVATGSVKRDRFSDDVDPFNTRQNRLRRKSGRKAATKRKCQRKKYSITSVVRWMCLMVAALLPQVPAAPLHRPAIQTEENGSDKQAEVSLLMPERPRAVENYTVPYDPNLLFLKIPRLSVHWTDDLSLIWLENWSVRLILDVYSANR
jgi:hypothetical protein